MFEQTMKLGGQALFMNSALPPCPLSKLNVTPRLCIFLLDNLLSTLDKGLLIPSIKLKSYNNCNTLICISDIIYIHNDKT